MIRGIVLAAAALALFSGAYLLSLQAAKSQQTFGGNGSGAARYREPEILLGGVEVREIRADGRSQRFSAESASYAVLSKRFSAEQVTLTLQEEGDKVVVRAPRGEWDMERGTVDLPEGGTAESGGGWTASVPEARVELGERRLTAGKAILSIPGVRVTGSGLVWRWEEGTVELSAPESLVLPDRLGKDAARKERGETR